MASHFIERTSTSGLRPLAAAAHVKRLNRMGPSARIEFVDHSELSIARQLHAVQMLAYAQEA